MDRLDRTKYLHRRFEEWTNQRGATDKSRRRIGQIKAKAWTNQIGGTDEQTNQGGGTDKSGRRNGQL